MSEIDRESAAFARKAWLGALERSAAVDRDPQMTLPLLLSRLAEQRSDAPALLSREGNMSYGQLARRIHRYARWALAQGLRAGDTAALLMPNRPDYLAAWLGLTRAGIKVALLNTQLTGPALAHCVRVVGPRALIAGAELADAYAAIGRSLPETPRAWVAGASEHDLAPLEPELLRFDDSPLTAKECPAPTVDATALYIYTSGTTGLPKAAAVSHYRVMQWSHWFAGMLDTGPDDRMYDCLPLYHSVGGVVATGATLVAGGAVVIRRRFSASDFWRDVREERCTLFQYIGELCRYLVNAPPQPGETAHLLRIACGNGLRPEVWQAFRSRFKIPRILEYYASTEGNFSLYNCEGEVGAIGRIPPFLAARLPIRLLRFDVERGEPLRNVDGRCETCGVDEVGEAVGRMPAERQQRQGRFEGYTDEAQSERKILRDVFDPGDAWYRTGDLMRRDARGFYYFVDRVGDTYRWKGENVSTAEVLTALTSARGVREGVVYGVRVPNADGRVGMAALVVDGEFDFGALRAHLAERLPGYARPAFLRLVPYLDATGTFKPRKQELSEQGFDPARVGTAVYFDDPRTACYVTIDDELLNAIIKGRVRI